MREKWREKGRKIEERREETEARKSRNWRGRRVGRKKSSKIVTFFFLRE